jgi:NADH-quinone oxidoreductase subunit B
MLMDAILTLHEQVMDSKLGANRTRQIAELEAEALAAPATIEMRGLLR